MGSECLSERDEKICRGHEEEVKTGLFTLWPTRAIM